MASKVDIHAAKHELRKKMGWAWRGRHTRHWHGLPPGIVGIGFGMKRAGGILQADTECVRVYVSRKIDDSELTDELRIPRDIEGYPTDVIPVGRFKPHQGPGGPISNSQGLSGTLACVVQDTNARYLLGSWHVMTNTIGKDGDPIYMPSLAIDANAPRVARLIATPIFNLGGGDNAFDAAVAKIEDGVQIDAALAPGQPFGACSVPSAGTVVSKRGALTGDTQGTVEGVSEDIPVMYNGRASDRAMLTGQIVIAGTGGAFSAEGDSGSLVWTGDRCPIGVLAGGSFVQGGSATPLSFVSPIQPILDFYELTIKVA